MKKALSTTLAVLLAFSMVLCVSAAANPTVEIGTASAAVGAEVTVTVSGFAFDTVKGMDLKVAVPEGVTIQSVATDDFEAAAYKQTATELHIVDSFVKNAKSRFTVTLTVKADAAGAYPITATGKFVDASEAFMDTVVISNGLLSVKDSVEDQPTEPEAVFTPTKKPGFFVPYGGVYEQGTNGKYLDKNADGTFVGTGSAVDVTYFPLPVSPKVVTTFAYSTHKADPNASAAYLRTNNIQFGSYVVAKESKTFGTLLIIGDYAKFKATQTMTDEEIFVRFAELYKANIENNPNYNVNANYEQDSYLKIKIKDTDEYLYIGRATQKKVMWEGANGELQYALRVYDVNPERIYTAVGYSLTDGAYDFSKGYKSLSGNIA